MNHHRNYFRTLALIGAAMIALPAAAKEKEAPLTVAKCSASLGSIAVVDGDTQGWTKYGLGSPRDLIAALATESGCFTIHSQASGTPANFLMNVIAGDKEEVDKGVEMAKGAAVEGLVRSGAASGLLRNVPVGGALIGMFGGLGGKKKTVAAGIRVISPLNGMTLVTGSGEVKKSSLTFGGLGGGLAAGASAAGYAGSGDGKMLTEAFIKAFNAVVGQGAALSAAAPTAAAAPAPAPAAAVATVAVDTRMLNAPATSATALRTLRASTTLTPTGKREGLFVEVKDSFGTQGWVSVEDLR
jgi:hypothetical protein